jgi:anti-sigma B factor antagonist
MPLALQKEKVGDFVVFRCQGRIVLGEEIRALQAAVNPASCETRKVLLHLGDISFIDSAGIGALMRLLRDLRSHGCELNLCHLSDPVERVLRVTNLVGVLPCYATEEEAIRGGTSELQSAPVPAPPAKLKIVCADTSREVLEYVSTLLKRSGYEVLASRNASDALTLVKVSSPHVVICGAGIQADAKTVQKMRESSPKARLIFLPPDFSASDAGDAGTHLVEQIRSAIAARP